MLDSRRLLPQVMNHQGLIGDVDEKVFIVRIALDRTDSGCLDSTLQLSCGQVPKKDALPTASDQILSTAAWLGLDVLPLDGRQVTLLRLLELA